MAVIVNGTEIVLTGTVGGAAWWDEDYFTHADVIGALAQVGREADITVRVNSGGGVASEGAAIHAAFAAHKGTVEMIVEGWAASAASLFVMAGDKVTMRRGAFLTARDIIAEMRASNDEAMQTDTAHLNRNPAATASASDGWSKVVAALPKQK